MLAGKQFEKLAQKLDIIIKLVAGNLLKEVESKTQKVKILHNLGIPTKEIAQLIGSTEASVETLKTRLRKRVKLPEGDKKPDKD